MNYYKVSLLRSSAPHLTYCSDEKISAGVMVSVPLKSTTKDAVIVSETKKPEFETEEIISVSDHYYTSDQMKTAKFICEYYFSSFSEAISLFLPFRQNRVQGSGLSVQDDSPLPVIPDSIRNPGQQVTLRPSGTWILNQVQDDDQIQSDRQTYDNDQIAITKPVLTPEQQKAYEAILTKERPLLFGVTGSGKTEIFISLMIKMLKEGKTSIFLMPEISLTPQMEKRLRVYFGDSVAMWHSRITKKRKKQILEGIERGEIRIVAGARSALFVPLPDLGLIIVDEEHDDSYKAMTRPRYHARDVAVLIGQKTGAKVLLASATPCVTSYYKYDVVKLEKPYIQSRKRYRFVHGNGIGEEIVEVLKQNFHKGGQSLLFLPTRGNFKYLYCENCGKTHRCPYCSVGMALHRKYRHLKCHYCNYTEPIKDTCIECGYTPLKSERIGTAEAIEQIADQIDGIRIEQFDKDSITTHKKLKEALKRFENEESHLLLGTQMLSKGHDYANITLSVVMGLDHILGLADYRARERALSLLFQIAGRSGRASESEVIVQTSDRDFFVPYLHDYEVFIKDELSFLEIAHYPPFYSLARILIAHRDEAEAGKITLDTAMRLKEFEEIEIVGSGKAPIERIANKYRFQILLRSENRVPLLKALHTVDRREIEIDMDPIEFS